MNEKVSSKAGNNEIVKALVIITKDFYNARNPDKGYAVTIDETNLVQRISLMMHGYPTRLCHYDAACEPLGQFLSPLIL